MKQVTAALMMRDDKMFIARRATDQKLAGMWEFPGGKIEPGETAEECLARELHEEFGITVKVGEFFCDSTYRYAHGAIQLLCYWVEHLSGDFKPTVHDEIAWVELSELSSYEFAPADIPVVAELVKKFTDTRGEI